MSEKHEQVISAHNTREGSMNENIILAAIGSTEPSSFGEFCNALKGDCPTEKSEWRELFAASLTAARDGKIETKHERKQTNVRNIYQR